MEATLQYCNGFCHTLTWISHGCTCVPHPETPSHLPPHPIPQGCPSVPALGALFHALNLDWWSVSHMYQCYSLKSSHPRLLPQSPKACSLYLVSLLLSCIYGHHCHLSKFYICALIYCIGVFLSDLFHSVSVQFSSVSQSCPTLWNPMNRSTPGLPVHHQLLESTQTQVHWVGDSIQPSHPLSSPSPPALSLSQQQGLYNESPLHIRWPKYFHNSFGKRVVTLPSQHHFRFLNESEAGRPT